MPRAIVYSAFPALAFVVAVPFLVALIPPEYIGGIVAAVGTAIVPIILNLYAGLRKIRTEQSSQAERIVANEEKARTAEARATKAERENDVLRDQIVLVLNRQDHDVAAFGEALLIQNGDMNDPVKAKDKATP